jgi:uncharacterized protein YbbC (DUF1343 family)
VQILYHMYHEPGTKMFVPDASGDAGPSAFDHIAGTDALRLALQNGKTPEDIIASWQPGLTAFREARRPYLLYGERPKSDGN